MEQTATKSLDRSFRFYLTLGLSICPVSLLAAQLLSAILGLDFQAAKNVCIAAGWLSIAVGFWCICRWLHLSHKPSAERAVKGGLLFILYWVWFGFWGLLFIGLTD